MMNLQTNERLKILLCVDLQPEFADANKEQYEKCLDYIAEHRTEYDKIVATVFKNKEGNNFTEKLKYYDCLEIEALEFLPDVLIVKDSYSFDVENYFSASDEIHVIGVDSDACVTATAFRLWDANFNFTILTDFTYTNAKEFDKADVIKLWKRNFGTCSLV